jgi:hypothetical protein
MLATDNFEIGFQKLVVAWRRVEFVRTPPPPFTKLWTRYSVQLTEADSVWEVRGRCGEEDNSLQHFYDTDGA